MRLDIAHIRRRMHRIWVWMVRKDAIIYLLFVGLATLFWWGRAMSSHREIDVKIPIHYTNVPNQVVFDEALPSHIKVTLRDNGRLLRQVQHMRPSISIDIQNKLCESVGSLQISTEHLRQRVQDILPGSTTIQQVNPEEIRAAYHTEGTKTVPIKLCATWQLEEQYQLSEAPHLSPTHVEIYGTDEALSAMDSICTTPIDIGRLYDIVEKELPLQLPAGIRCSVESIRVRWSAEEFTEKSFDLPIEVIGKPTDEMIHLFPQIAKVTVRVGISNFSEVSSNDLQAVCHYPTNKQNTLMVKIISNNPHITQIRSNVREVEYIIER